MAAQINERRETGDEQEHSRKTRDDQDRNTTPVNPLVGIPSQMSTWTIIDVPAEVSSYESGFKSKHKYGPFTGPERPTWVPGDVHPPWVVVSATPTWSTKKSATALWESQGWQTSQITTSPTRLATDDAFSPSGNADDYGSGRPDRHGAEHGLHGRAMYAAAIIAPIIVLAVVGGIVFICLRKRKRQQVQAAAAQLRVQEMKTHPRPQATVQPYVAPSSTSPPQYTASRSHLPPSFAATPPQPVILGPIPSGANGAYFTGIDTSDVVSMTSASNLRPPPDPFSDNNSLSEPPPPYRPRSTAPPSLTASSRHSSFRSSVAMPTTSQTHLIERSPFDDAADDDAISELSGPTGAQHEDAMSAVSDLSYQNDPVVNRTSL